MSGGAFDYWQYQIESIADKIEELLADVAKPRPPKLTVHYVSIKKQVGEGHYVYPSYAHYSTIESAYRYLRACAEEVDGHIYDCFDTWKDKDGNVHRCEYFVSEGDYEDWAEGYEEECYYGPDYSEQTLAEFRNAVEALRRAYVYAQRVDWLLSGDDGEDNFHIRLAEDLAKISKNKKE